MEFLGIDIFAIVLLVKYLVKIREKAKILPLMTLIELINADFAANGK
jgi:hypothetical protein